MDRRTKRYLEALWLNIRSTFFAAVAIFGAAGILWVLGLEGLLDARTIISVVVPEVGIGVFLYYFLGEHRRGRVDEVINLMNATKEFAHLNVYVFSVLHSPFDWEFYFVENTTTKQCYEAPQYIESMAEQEIIIPKKCKNEAEMTEYLNENGTHLNDRKPSPSELLAVKHRKKSEKLISNK